MGGADPQAEPIDFLQGKPSEHRFFQRVRLRPKRTHKSNSDPPFSDELLGDSQALLDLYTIDPVLSSRSGNHSNVNVVSSFVRRMTGHDVQRTAIDSTSRKLDEMRNGAEVLIEHLDGRYSGHCIEHRTAARPYLLEVDVV